MVNIHPIGAVTIGQEGRADHIPELIKVGAVGISETANPSWIPPYMQGYDRSCQEAVYLHCEDKYLAGAGYKQELRQKAEACRYNNAVEDIIVARDIYWQGTGTRLHLCHCSTGAVLRCLGWRRIRA